jgi:hypothetical protein
MFRLVVLTLLLSIITIANTTTTMNRDHIINLSTFQISKQSYYMLLGSSIYSKLSQDTLVKELNELYITMKTLHDQFTEDEKLLYLLPKEDTNFIVDYNDFITEIYSKPIGEPLYSYHSYTDTIEGRSKIWGRTIEELSDDVPELLEDVLEDVSEIYD